MNDKRFLFLKFILGAAIFFGFWHFSVINDDPDLGWHLRAGEKFYLTHAVESADTYSFTMPGYEWVDHEWLSNFITYWFYHAGLKWLLVLLFSAMAFIPFIFWLARARTYPAVLLIFLAGSLLTLFVGVRPQIISFFLFWLVYEMLQAHFDGRSDGWGRGYYFLPAIFLIWANVHAGFFGGLALFGLIIAARAWECEQKIKSIWLAVRLELLMFGGCALIVLVNPYGWKLYREVLLVFFSGDIGRYIAEWQNSAKFYLSELLFLAGAALFLIWQNWRKFSTRVIWPTLAFGILAFKSVRMNQQFVVVALPLICAGFDELAERVRRARAQLPFTASDRKKMMMAGILALALCAGLLVNRITAISPRIFPADAVEYLRSRQIASADIRLFNNYNWGGYLIWNLPGVPVFVDGRMPHWRNRGTGDKERGTEKKSAMVDYLTVYVGPTSTREIFNKYQINTVLISNQPPKPNWAQRHWPWLQTWLGNTGRDNNKLLKEYLLSFGWRVGYEDKVAVVLERR